MRKDYNVSRSRIVVGIATVFLLLLFTIFRSSSNIGTQQGNVVSVGASVLPNPYNTLALQLRERDEELKKREGEIVVRERALTKASESDLKKSYGGWMLAILLLLTFGAHLYVDEKRRTQV